MEPCKNSILIVDDEKQNLETLVMILSPEYNVYAVKNGQDAYKVAKKQLPDVILLDILMPNMNGFEVFEKIKSDTQLSNIPIIFITALGRQEDEEKGLAMGAADYVVKPYSPSIVKLRVRNQMQIINQIETIKQLSTMDQLTKIPNRRSFDYRICLEYDRAKRDKTPLSLLMLDIDNFKKYNDTYGHLQGDAVLQTVAKIIEQSLRRSIDFAARWGGEEFAVILQDTDAKGAYTVAEIIRKNIEKTVIPCHKDMETKITVSIGVNTCIPVQNYAAKELFCGADKALYKAKKSGKNKTHAYKF
ncbi:MAG: diguanylate cyclase [Treponema sp.]|jgi:diguanylate cyclase (GGDEF)-like protein|nr:diguanylate cyclase [Treponema sp.]